MTQCNNDNVNLSNSQLDKIKLAPKCRKSDLKIFIQYDFVMLLMKQSPHDLLLTRRQVLKLVRLFCISLLLI